MPITTGSIKGEESSTTTFKVRTVTINQNSSNMQQEILTIGDPQTSNALARVVAAPPVSTEFGVIVRIASGPSSAADLPVQISGNSTAFQGGSWTVRANLSSTNTDNPVRAILSSTSADNPVTVSGNSTVFQGGSWTVRANLSSTNADNPVRAILSSTSADNPVSISGNSTVFQGTSPWVVSVNSRVNIGSTAADNAVTISGNSTAVIQGNSTVIQGTSPWVTASIMQSSNAPSSASSGVIVRTVIDNILTTASSNAFASTSLSIQSSAASIRSYVTAFSITSTVQAPTAVKFMSGSTLLWPVVLAALSSAVTGVNLAVSAPAYLFRTKSAGPLSLNVASSVAGFKVAVSYFRAP